MKRLIDFSFVAGGALVVAGVALVSVPAGMVVAGAGFLATAWYGAKGLSA